MIQDVYMDYRAGSDRFHIEQNYTVVLYTATTVTFSICMSSWRSISLAGIGSFLTQETGWSRRVVALGTR
jgi:hypothetical protein